MYWKWSRVQAAEQKRLQQSGEMREKARRRRGYGRRLAFLCLTLYRGVDVYGIPVSMERLSSLCTMASGQRPVVGVSEAQASLQGLSVPECLCVDCYS